MLGALAEICAASMPSREHEEYALPWAITITITVDTRVSRGTWSEAPPYANRAYVPFSARRSDNAGAAMP